KCSGRPQPVTRYQPVGPEHGLFPSRHASPRLYEPNRSAALAPHFHLTIVEICGAWLIFAILFGLPEIAIDRRDQMWPELVGLAYPLRQMAFGRIPSRASAGPDRAAN